MSEKAKQPAKPIKVKTDVSAYSATFAAASMFVVILMVILLWFFIGSMLDTGFKFGIFSDWVVFGFFIATIIVGIMIIIIAALVVIKYIRKRKFGKAQ